MIRGDDPNLMLALIVRAAGGRVAVADQDLNERTSIRLDQRYDPAAMATIFTSRAICDAVIDVTPTNVTVR